MSAVLKMRMNGKNYFIIMADIVLSITGNKKIGTLIREFGIRKNVKNEKKIW